MGSLEEKVKDIISKVLYKSNKVLILTFLLVSIIISGCTSTSQKKGPQVPPVDQEALKLLPITSRNFSIGTAGYFPANFPNPSINDVKNFWDDVVISGDVYGIHTDWKDTTIIDTAAKQIDLDLVVVLGFQKVEEWKNSKNDLKNKVVDILNKNPKIKYLGIGNEINLDYEKNTKEFTNFINTYKEIYKEIKSKHPAVKVFTVFQLEAMKGEGYLTGKSIQRNPQWSILKNFENNLDLVVFTSYPHLDYKNPSDIPANYFTEIQKYTTKPIAFSEIAWPAQEKYGSSYENLNKAGYTGSEQEQIDFLIKFLVSTKTTNLEFVNWSFINDYTQWGNGISGNNLPIFDSVALKYNNGTEKKVWNVWLALKSLEKVD